MGMVLTGEIHITNTGNIMCNRGQINARSVPDYAWIQSIQQTPQICDRLR